MDILPKQMWAVAMIATCPNAVVFNPREIAFTDTATLFAPRDDLSGLPFDLLFLSRIYRYFFALAGRMSFLDMMRSHVYPTNLRLLPWNESLSLVAQPLEALRKPLVAACSDAFRTEGAMMAELERLPLIPFRDAVREQGGSVDWSESFQRAAEKIEVSRDLTFNHGQDHWRLQVSDYLYDWLDITAEDAARELASALRARPGDMVDRDSLLSMGIPSTSEIRTQYDEIVARYATADHQGAIEAVVDRIDALVGPALGLDDADLAAIRHDMLTDPFLKNIVPRWPGTSTRLHGYRTGLDSAKRYA